LDQLLGYLDSIKIYDGISLLSMLWVVVIAAVALVLERLIVRYVRKFAKKARLEPEVTNGIVLTFRLLILIGALASLTKISGVSTDWFLAFSALGGAAVGFASQQTIGNFVAGLYLLATRPFKVGDLVRIGTVEGIVQEVTINYTKVLTIGNNMVSIINLNVLQRDITNFLYENDEGKELYCYTFEITFDHSVSSAKIEEIFDTVFEQRAGKMPKKPSYVILRSGGFERVYMVYLYVERPEDVFTLRPLITENVFRHWDEERAKTKE
jgi:small-conductance mechanosensitive channel